MAGHRLLLVHLFLPDTLSFQDWNEEGQNTHYRVPSQQIGQVVSSTDDVPPPPSPDATQASLPVNELKNRLTKASLSRDDEQMEDDSAFSDSESPAVPISIPPRSRSARSSFNEQSRKISMSMLMSEAAQGSNLNMDSNGSSSTGTSKISLSPPGSAQYLTHSRRNSGSVAGLPIITKDSAIVDASVQVAVVAASSDHGRSATIRKSPSHNSLPLPSHTTSSPRSNSGGFPHSLHASTSLIMTPAQFGEASNDGSGTKAPGARVSGKAGTMTPLSIIGDLAAKQSAIVPRQQPTPGDSERHHPFGSGAVTPMPGAQSVGPSRTPGSGSKPFLQHVLSKTPMSISQRALTELPERGHSGTSLRPSQPRSRHSGIGKLTEIQEQDPASSHGRLATSPTPIEGDRHSSERIHRRRDIGPDQSPQIVPNSSSAAVMANPSAWTRTRARTQSRAGIGKRPLSMRLSTRRMSSTSFDLVLDEDVDEEESVLPPYDFTCNPSSNGGLMNAASSLPRDRLRGGKVYIGTPGISTETWASDRERKEISSRFYKEKSSVPVWVEDETFEGAYNHFCKQILWPTFHYTLPSQKGLDNEHASFRDYQKVNELFAEAILKEYKEGDIIWINDYHLLLVPQLLREKLPHATIGFFLHICFPSSEIFRCLSVRVEILRGMLGSDLIGFQTHNFCRHFRQTVSRILQLEATPKGIQMDGRGGFVTVSPFPIGIDVRSLNRRRADPDVREWVDKLQLRYEDKKIIVGRDKLDWIKGVRQKLLAFELFLNEHQDWVGKVVLIQVALATTEENEEVAAATDVVARINNKYSTLTYQPVVFLHVQDITFSQYLALLTVADCCLNSSRREGMGLTPHEYVVCQEEKHSPLILSELSGTYSALQACIGINPWNTKQMAHAIYKALTMTDEEAFDRWKDLHRQVVTQTAQHWIQSLLGRLEKAHISRERKNNFFIPRLEIGQLVSEWRASKSRLMLFDLEDTLVQEVNVCIIGKGSADRVMKKLEDLCNDAQNRVYVLSGRGANDLDRLIARIPQLGLIAENGCSIMYAGEPEGGREIGKKEWMSLVAGTDLSWRDPVKEILLYFTERTPGSQMEDRGTSILWRFWTSEASSEFHNDEENRDFQWSRRQAAEVQNLIYDSLGERFSIRIIPGRVSFLIMPKNVSRASAIQHIISLSQVGRTPMQSTNGSNSNGSSNQIQTAPYPLRRHKSELVPSVEASASKQPINRMQTASSSSTAVITSRKPTFRWQNDDFTPSRKSTGAATTNPFTLHPNGMGTFDFVLCIGQDDMLLNYINSLDLPFAPVTCTSTFLDESGQSQNNHGGGSSEANYFLHGVEDVYTSLAEIVAFKGRDLKWGHTVMDA